MVEGLKIEGEPGKRSPIRPSVRDSGLFGGAETLRPDTRADSVREAEEYAQHLLEGGDYGEYTSDEFHIDRAEIPEGWSYQWKSAEIANMPNTHHMLELARGGWRAVPTKRHRSRMPPGTPDENPIVVKGLILMELPEVLTKRAELAHIRASKEALRNSEEKLRDTPPNTAPRNDPGLIQRGLTGVQSREYVTPGKGRADD